MRTTLLIALLLAVGIPSTAKKKKKPAAATQTFDYYLLTLSWAPDFCAQSKSKDPGECKPGNKLGFVVHGLWPQGETGRGPVNCGGSPVSQSIVQSMLSYIPTASLVQHEWQAHGTCSGLSSADYFATVRKARDSVKIPGEFTAPGQALDLKPAAIESAFATANPAFPKDAIRTSCTAGALQDVRICFNKDLSARACTASAGECTMGTLKVLPVK